MKTCHGLNLRDLGWDHRSSKNGKKGTVSPSNFYIGPESFVNGYKKGLFTGYSNT